MFASIPVLVSFDLFPRGMHRNHIHVIETMFSKHIYMCNCDHYVRQREAGKFMQSQQVPRL